MWLLFTSPQIESVNTVLCPRPPGLRWDRWVSGNLQRPGDRRGRRGHRRCPSALGQHLQHPRHLLPLLLAPKRPASRPGLAEPHLLLVERGLLPAQRLGVTAVDPVVALSFPLQLLQTCTQEVLEKKTHLVYLCSAAEWDWQHFHCVEKLWSVRHRHSSRLFVFNPVITWNSLSILQLSHVSLNVIILSFKVH